MHVGSTGATACHLAKSPPDTGAELLVCEAFDQADRHVQCIAKDYFLKKRRDLIMCATIPFLS